MSTFTAHVLRCTKCHRIEWLNFSGACLNCANAAWEPIDYSGRTREQVEKEYDQYEELDASGVPWEVRHELDRKRRRDDEIRKAYELALTAQRMVNDLTLGYPAPYGPWQVEMPPHTERRDGSKDSWIIRGDTVTVGECYHRYEDAAFFAQSRWVVPQLCSRIFELVEEIKRLDEAVKLKGRNV